MSDTPIFDNLLRETGFAMREGEAYGRDKSPPRRKMTLVDAYGDEVVWTGKRWYDPKTSDGDLQTQEAWPPSEGLWREVKK
jgi:hypothetical protein